MGMLNNVGIHGKTVFILKQGPRPHQVWYWYNSLALLPVYHIEVETNGCHFADIFKRIFLNGNVSVSIKISLKFVPKGPIINSTTLVQIMAWRRPGDKPLSEPMMLRLPMYIFVTRPHWVIPTDSFGYINSHGNISCDSNSLASGKNNCHFNSLWPSNTIWRLRSGSTLAQIMACCLMASSHYLNQSWLIMRCGQQHSHESNFPGIHWYQSARWIGILYFWNYCHISLGPMS